MTIEMPEKGSPLDEIVQQFRATIAPDVYTEHAFVPWELIDSQVAALAAPIGALQRLVESSQVEPTALAEALLKEPGVAIVAKALFVAPHAVGFSDGRELPEEFDPRFDDALVLAGLLVDLGLGRILPTGSRVADLYRVAAIAVDARRRGFRRRDNLERVAGALVDDAMKNVAQRTGAKLERVTSPASQPEEARGRGLEVIAASGRPVAAVSTVFQATGGGRQSRDLAVTQPRIQEDLDAIPMSLIVIADGRGVLDASPRVLATLFDSVAACLSLLQAESGQLADALEMAVVNRGARTTGRASLARVIESRLSNQVSVSADELPAPPGTVELAFAAYLNEHADLALRVSADGGRIEWIPEERVSATQKLRIAFERSAAVGVLASALGMKDTRDLGGPSDVSLTVRAGEVPGDPVLPHELVIAASGGVIDEEAIRATARLARQRVAGATLAVLVAPDASSWTARPDALGLQRATATSVVVIDVADLLLIAGSTNPRDALVRRVLLQADLVKASPFRSTGATPPEMFFGREQEASDLLGILASSSAALIGGRRIGKTSLLHQVTRVLETEGWQPLYADLQEAGDWATFADHIRLRWDVDVQHSFSPSAIALVVRELQARRGGRLVLLLDEVDHLLRWDQDHGDAYVPEAFFRACRALSQEGATQFVFSGERTIAERLWDPASPHWNFCRPLPVKQLTRHATDELLERPLRSLGVALDDRDEALQLAWARSEGHPQIVQRLGEELVNRLNARPPDQRSALTRNDIASVSGGPAYAQHYVTTYWGQATTYERLITALIAVGARDKNELRDALEDHDSRSDAEALEAALRMLDLYGIVDDLEGPLQLRAAWLPEAMEALGGAARLAKDLSELDRP
jgi:hypothetical protein